jgi:hypothetical protein
MSPRIAAVLVVLLLALGGGALLLHKQGQLQSAAGAAALGQTLLKNFAASDVVAISIREPGATLTLERRGEEWVIKERAGFPADLDKVRGLVLKALELKVGQSEPIGEQDRARLKLDDSATRLEFRGAEGKVLARLTIGAKFFRRETENPARATADGRYVMLPDEPKVVYVVADPLALASVKSTDWIHRGGFAAEKVKSMQVTLAGGERWKIERPGDSANWKLTPMNAGEKLDVIRANSASYSLNNVDLADVAAPDIKAADAGLDRPAATIVAATFDGLTYTVKLGNLVGDNAYVAVSIAGAGSATGPDAEERGKKLVERLPRERALAAHTLLVAKSKFDDILKKRAELLEKKDAGRKK